MVSASCPFYGSGSDVVESLLIVAPIVTLGRQHRKRYQQSTNADQKSIETVFSNAICYQYGDKWQSRTLVLTLFYLRSSIVLGFSIATYRCDCEVLCSIFCCALLCVLSSFAIILMGKRELVALLCLSSWCLAVDFPHFTMSWSAVCDCGISRSHSFAFLNESEACIQKNIDRKPKV